MAKKSKRVSLVGLLKKAKLNQKQFAGEIGVTRETVSLWVRGLAVPRLTPAQTRKALEVLACEFEEWAKAFDDEDQAEPE